MAAEIQRILVVRTDRLGDVLLTLPMLPVIRARFPRSHLAMLLRHYTGEIVEGNRYADEILWYDDRNSPVPFFKMLGRIRAGKFDAAIVVHPTLRLALLMALAGIPLRIGSGYRYYSVLFNSRIYEHRKDAKRHEAEYNLNLLAPLGCTLPEGRGPLDLSIAIDIGADRAAGEVLENAGIVPACGFVVIHPGTGGSARVWPTENFWRIARLAAEKEGRRVVVTGAAGEEELCDTLARNAGPGVVSCAGKFSLKELAAVMKRADLCIAHSTGPLHLAVAVGTPVVGLYPQLTAMSPRRWGPYTTNARVYEPARPADCRDCSGPESRECACMASITVETVAEGMHALLATKSGVGGQ